MEQKEIIAYVIIGNIILLVFITGMLIFVFQYRKRKIQHRREKNRMQERHRLELLNSQVETQRQTMKFIGAEIHDSVSQKLTLASLYTQRMEFGNKSPEIKEQLEGISRIINDTLAELKNLSRSLTDNRLQQSGLDEILAMECEQVNTTGICTARFRGGPIPPVPVTIKSPLLRIAQEFIQNSLKHSGCKRISFTLNFNEEEGLQLLMEDDGRGFEPEAVQLQGMGLRNIETRIEKIGGRYRLDTAPQMGVRMLVTIPAAAIQNYAKQEP
jgi:signal transduction histidine kinase